MEWFRRPLEALPPTRSIAYRNTRWRVRFDDTSTPEAIVSLDVV